MDPHLGDTIGCFFAGTIFATLYVLLSLDTLTRVLKLEPDCMAVLAGKGYTIYRSIQTTEG